MRMPNKKISQARQSAKPPASSAGGVRQVGNPTRTKSSTPRPHYELCSCDECGWSDVVNIRVPSLVCPACVIPL